MIKVSWNQLKTFASDRSSLIQYIDKDDHYYIYSYDGPFSVSHIIRKDNPASSDQSDFETNFMSSANGILNPTDIDGVPLAHTKIAPAGWHAQVHCLEFDTSTLGSVYNKSHDLSDLGFTTIKFYDENDVELTVQASIDTLCVKTVVEWEPDHDFSIIGGELHQSIMPSEDVRLWIVGVPDVPKASGGSVEFTQGGLNLRRLGDGILKVDGRTPKMMSYDATWHLNKFQMIARHSEGYKCPVYFMFHIYKSGTT